MTTWNASQKSTTITLTNGNLTATKSAGNNTNAIVCATPGLTTGKYYFESVHTFATAANTAIGIGNTSSVVQGIWLGQNSDTIGYWSDGGVYNAGVLVNTLATWTTGSNVSVAVDLVNNKIWFRVNGGNWNNSSSNHPETNVGGIAIAAGIIAHAVVDAASLFQLTPSADVVLAKFASADWTYAAPVFDAMVATATGTSSTSVVGSSQVKSVSAATGVASSSVIAGAAGNAVATGVASSSVIAGAAGNAVATGVASSSVVGSGQTRAVTAAAGTSSSSVIAGAAGKAVATGTSTALTTGNRLARSTAAASGAAVCIGRSPSYAVAQAAGTATSNVVGSNRLAPPPAQLTTSTHSAVSAIALADQALLTSQSATATASGTSTASAVGSFVLGTPATAAASGTSTANGAGSSFFSFFSRGVAAGDSSATALGLSSNNQNPRIIWIGRT